MPLMKECGTHEKRKDVEELQKLCESCGRNYFICDMCRTTKNITTSPNICIKCSPALKTLKTILSKKDIQINSLTEGVKKLEADNRNFAEAHETTRKQLNSMKRQNEELKMALRNKDNELNELREKYDDIQRAFDNIKEQTRARDRLIKDLQTMLSEQVYPDVTIEVGESAYSAHRGILAARSEPLKIALEPVADPKDKRKEKKLDVNMIQLTDINENIMASLLTYLYTGSIEGRINESNVGDIIKAADKFELNELKDIGFKFIEKRIDRNTVISTLIQAATYKNERIKKKCINFLNKEAIDLLNSNEWYEFKHNNPEAALDLYEARLKDLKNDDQERKSTSTVKVVRMDTNRTINRSHAKLPSIFKTE